MIELTTRELVEIIGAVGTAVGASVWKLLKYFEARNKESGIEGLLKTFILTLSDYQRSERELFEEQAEVMRTISASLAAISQKLDSQDRFYEEKHNTLLASVNRAEGKIDILSRRRLL